MKEIYIDFAEAARKLNAYGYTLFTLHGKKPAVTDWKSFIGKQQSVGALNKLFRRPNITGLGIVLENNLRVLDIDGTDDVKIIDELLKWLGLPRDYRHIVKSGNGFHIYFYCKDEEKIIEKYFGSDKAYSVIKVKDDYKVKQIELRWANCYMVGPYSRHPSGKQYLYLNGVPEEKAESIEPERMLIALNKISPIKGTVKENQNEKEYDGERLQNVSEYLKTVHLDYTEWIQCGYALAQIGEEGRKYFLNLSINKFYPDDTLEGLNKDYNKILKYYKTNKTTLGTLFYYAQKNGYIIPKGVKKQSAEFLEFVLCVLSYPEKDKNKLLQMILHYAMIEKIRLKKLKEKIKEDLFEPIKKRMQVYDTKNAIMQNHKRMKDYVESHIKKYGSQPYCRIGEDFFLESIQGKFDYLTFRILCAITAIQGKKEKWKTITKERMRAGIEGYKAVAILNKELKNYKSISDYKIRERVENLRELKIISHITTFRNTYYSTFLQQNELENLAENRYNANFIRKLENDSVQKDFMKRINENKKRLIKQKRLKIKPLSNFNYEKSQFNIN